MKTRILSLLLTLCLLLLRVPALGEDSIYETIENALYQIVLRTEEGDVHLGSGVLFMKQDVILTAESCCQAGELVAIGTDGEHAVQSWQLLGDAGAALIYLSQAASAQPLTLSDYNASLIFEIFGTDAEGFVCSSPLYQVFYAMRGDQLALTLSGEEGLTPGAVVVDDQARVMALAVAQQTEGIGMYAALEADHLYAALTEPQEAKDLLPLEISWEDGILTVAWQDDTARSSGLYVVSLSAAQNLYYTTYKAEYTADCIRAVPPPGQTYYIQAQWVETASQAGEPTWDTIDIFTAPTGDFTAYGFTQTCYLASAPAGEETDAILPQAAVTRDMILDDQTSMYLQVICSYDVEETLQDALSLSLTGPDGQFFYDELGFTFAPEYEAEDAFAMPLDSLFESYIRFAGGTLPSGSYTVRYAIGGLEAGEYTFTLE